MKLIHKLCVTLHKYYLRKNKAFADQRTFVSVHLKTYLCLQSDRLRHIIWINQSCYTSINFRNNAVTFESWDSAIDRIFFISFKFQTDVFRTNAIEWKNNERNTFLSWKIFGCITLTRSVPYVDLYDLRLAITDIRCLLYSANF